ncbi:DCC1-like thiol-disulfide oxidoreductase family protein [Pontibacter sp. E15-1]|uniref:thiol-disulfide oxidoreductase DCC family protein n=1 Tax=Pontibacter sp. E15-1 TaxID=2919918 RepID=UPI001F4F82E0|nr:DCC1-like thiol-disulfide oxidoreductase family protein [Pontibacter sp. E15-1]MCJ8164953.1 DCC1-like thiol-disulfide oxidoreductase family protein [Pontibacter sp. E15-1]
MESKDTDQLRGKPVVFYDGTCGFCQASVQLVLKYNGRRDLYFAPLQSEAFAAIVPAAQRPEPLPDSVVFYEHGQVYTESEAVLRIARHLDFPVRALYYFRFIPLSFRNILYRFIARHRYKIAGREDACLLPSPADRARFVA